MKPLGLAFALLLLATAAHANDGTHFRAKLAGTHEVPAVFTPGDAVFSARVLDVTRGVVRLQTGYLYHYAFAMLIGVAALITWFMFGARAG